MGSGVAYTWNVNLLVGDQYSILFQRLVVYNSKYKQTKTNFAVNKYSSLEYEYEYKYLDLVLEYNSSSSTSTKYYNSSSNSSSTAVAAFIPHFVVVSFMYII